MVRGEIQFELDISIALNKNYDFDLYFNKSSIFDRMGDFDLQFYWKNSIKIDKIPVEVKSSVKRVLTYADFGDTRRERIDVDGVRPARQCYIATWIGALDTGQWLVLPPTFINQIFLSGGRENYYNHKITFSKRILSLANTLNLLTNEDRNLLDVLLTAMNRNSIRKQKGHFNIQETKLIECAVW